MHRWGGPKQIIGRDESTANGDGERLIDLLPYNSRALVTYCPTIRLTGGPAGDVVEERDVTE
jgi:hypothetical protein